MIGNALDAASYVEQVPKGATFVHLVGVAHPGPGKAHEFQSIDLASVRASLSAARATGASHFIYVSVAQPAPVMRAYIAARMEAEDLIRASGLPATLLRPWYVLGPGHLWPYLLLPFYWLAERLPPIRQTVLRLGLVSRLQMVATLVQVVETPTRGVRIVDVSEIRSVSAVDSV